jgi:catechol 2,3-dioxygenase-like lactoylglutathione lyase family enzyme
MQHDLPQDLPMNLNQVTASALNVADSVSFYRRLGLTQIVDSPHYARFVCPDGDATFSVHAADTVSPDSGVTVYFECDELDAVCAKLQQQGFDFLEMPVDQVWLWREARLADPSGNIICLYRAGENRVNPPWRIATE